MYNGLSADVPFSVFSVLIHSLMLHFPRVTSYIFFGVALFRAALFSVSIPFKFYLFHIALFWSSTFLCCTFFMFWIFPVVIFSDFFFFFQIELFHVAVYCVALFWCYTFSMLHFFLLHFPKAIKDRVSWYCTKYDKCIFLRKPALN